MSDAFLSNILVGVALVVSNVITLLTAARMPRRAMLLLSSAGIALTLVVLGVFFHLREMEEGMCAPGIPVSTPAPKAEKLLEVQKNVFPAKKRLNTLFIL